MARVMLGSRAALPPRFRQCDLMGYARAFAWTAVSTTPTTDTPLPRSGVLPWDRVRSSRDPAEPARYVCGCAPPTVRSHSMTTSRRVFLESTVAACAAAALTRPTSAQAGELNFPLLDLHVHLDNSTLDQVLPLAREREVKFGIVE